MRGRGSSKVDVLRRLVEANKETNLTGVAGSSAIACILASLAAGRNGPLLQVAPTRSDAERLVSDLEFFLSSAQGDGDAPRVHLYPPPDVQPYDTLQPHASLAMQRLAALHHLGTGTPHAVVVAPAEMLLRRVLPRAILAEHTWTLTQDQELERDRLVSQLVSIGYLSVDMVEDPGCMAVRGGVVDVFSPAHQAPIRVEFLGDTIASLRTFDPETQRSTGVVTRAAILPVREEILTPDHTARAVRELKPLCDRLGCPGHLRRQIVNDLETGIYFPGIEYLSCIIYPRLDSLLSHAVHPAARVSLWDPAGCRRAMDQAWDELQKRHAGVDQTDGVFPAPEQLFLTPEKAFHEVLQAATLTIGHPIETASRRPHTVSLTSRPTSGLHDRLTAHLHDDQAIPLLAERLQEWLADHHDVSIVVRSTVQADRLVQLLEPHGVPLKNLEPFPHPDHLLDALPTSRTPTVRIVPGRLSSGFVLVEQRLVVLSEEDIFGKRPTGSQSSSRGLKHAISSFSQLARGDFVVHSLHGVGIFRGIKKLEVDGVANDFVLLEYDGGDRLYLPVHRLSHLYRYTGGATPPRLDRLGGATFGRKKRKARRAILRLAHELLKLGAARAATPGFAFKPFDREMAEFGATFPYEETPDQAAAIREVLNDMCSPRPMDRLVCGDVGYGKTEVAVRASYLAVLNGKQVAVLAPTTVLALQHARSFAERFKHTPVTVEMLSRFKSSREQRATVERVKQGLVDIVVGTHRLLSPDVGFKDLGLLVIDEEQRFGVAHKERIKKLALSVDVLTLTATPIPRTLYMALSGVRHFSLMATPPPGRLAVRTHHLTHSPTRVQEAIRRELRRGGQVYYVHNRVHNIMETADTLRRLVPEARIAVAHGQMSPRQLERVMVDFILRKYDVLCCTSIIENGLDIPSVNTVIVDDADHLGLAQLYQLRGRVGRSSTRAFAYLFTRPGKEPNRAAQRRLRALVQFTDLGSGFRIAREDLEIRGAGDLLGPSQSGHIQDVGIDTYCELLEEAVRELQGEQAHLEIEPDIDLKVSAFFPEDYIPDLPTRLHCYKTLSQCTDEHAVQAALEEIEDRFGRLPEPARRLADIMAINALLKRLRISGLSYARQRLVFRFDQTTPVDPGRMVALVHQDPEQFRLTPDGRLVCSVKSEAVLDRIQTAKKVLRMLSQRGM